MKGIVSPRQASPLPREDRKVQAMQSAMQHLRTENRELRQQVEEMQQLVLELAQRQKDMQQQWDLRLASTQRLASTAFQQTRSILESRIWRGLVGAAGVALRVADRRRWLSGRQAGQALGEAGAETILAHLDEPLVDESEPVSGKVVVRGWATAASGVAKVEVLLGEATPQAARTGLYRPDIGKTLPEMPDSEKSGFWAEADTASVPSGTHLLYVRVTSRQGNTHELCSTLQVDHIDGFANPYARWISEFEERDTSLIRLQQRSFRHTPLISVLVPVYRTQPEILRSCIASVQRQSYAQWELILVDDRSERPAVEEVLRQAAAEDSRIRVHFRQENGGISAATNDALQLAQGEFIALLDHDDELAQDALHYMVDAINDEPETAIFYSDEDHMDESGRRFDPFFKPDWSPDLLLSENYVCHFMVFRRDLAMAAGGFRTVADLSQDHDILLRMSQQTGRVTHIPRILYHWRTSIGNMERASTQEDRVLSSSRRAVADHVAATVPGGSVEPGRVPSRWRVRYPIPAHTRASIVIPSGGKVDILERNINSIVDKTDFHDYEIVIADNSKATKIETFVRGWKRHGREARLIDLRMLPFNFSTICNRGAEACDTPLLVFLNDDTSVIEGGWLTALVEHAMRPEVGAVGAKLLYPDDRIQHAGIVMGVLGICGHAFKMNFHDQRLYFDFPDIVRNVSAVTAACIAVRRDVYWQVGGFDETDFPVAYNDVDLCLKISAAGYRVLYNPHALLYHYEAHSKTQKDLDPRPAETAALRRKWPNVIAHDPFYNPNLTTMSEDFSLRRLLLKAEAKRKR